MPTTPSGQPTGMPTSPSGQPTGMPTLSPIPFSKWFYGSFVDAQSGMRIALYIEFGIWSVFTAAQWYIKENVEQRKALGAVKMVLIYGMWYILDVATLCARLDFLLNEGTHYKPYILEGSGELVYFTDHLRYAGKSAREAAGCDYNTEAAESAPYDTCQYWTIKLGPDLATEGWVRFSLGLGLIIAICLRAGAFILAVISHKKSKKLGGFCSAEGFLFIIGMSVIDALLHLQQYIGLLPLEAALPNAYCIQMQVPETTKKAICLFKIAAAAIPYGLPMFVGCAIGAYFLFLMGMNLISEGENAIMAFFGFVCIAGAGYCAVYSFFGLTFIIFWFFGGIWLGIHYTVAGLGLDYLLSQYSFFFIAITATTYALLLADGLMFAVDGEVHDSRGNFELTAF
jgi:hypothetical protein